MQRLLVLIVIGAMLSAQPPLPPNVNRYSVSVSTTKLTVQNVANGNQMNLEYSKVDCGIGSTVIQSWNGTAATATAASILQNIGTARGPLGTAWSGSNVGAGTALGADTLSAGAIISYDLTPIILAPGTNNNYTITTSNACVITIQWRET